MSMYKPPDLDGHKVAFKGTRFWVIEIEDGRDFDCISKDMADLAVYDAAERMTIAWATRKEGGGYACGTACGQIAIEFEVDRIEDLGRVSDERSRWLADQCS